jgi:hypothetical protein
MPTVTMPSLSGLDFSKLDLSKWQLPKLDLTKFDVSKLDPRKIDLSKFDPRKIDLAKFDVAKIDVPTVDLPGVDVDRLGDLARDAAYAGIGLIAVTAEKVAERRREIQTEMTARARQLADAVA